MKIPGGHPQVITKNPVKFQKAVYGTKYKVIKGQ